MKLFNKLITIATLFIGTLAAQAYDIVPLTIPTVASGTTSNSIAAVSTCVKQQNVGFQWVINGGTAFGAGTNAIARVAVSVDGTTYDTNHFVLTNSTGILITNLSVGGFGFIRVDSVTSTGVISTNSIKVSRSSDGTK